MEINKKITKVIKKVFKKSKLKKDINKLSLKDIKEWDSLKHFHFLIEIEKEFNIRFDSNTFTKIKNIKEIISIIKKNAKH